MTRTLGSSWKWDRLIRFCRVPDVPLESNLIEQALMIPIRYLVAGFFTRQTDEDVNTRR